MIGFHTIVLLSCSCGLFMSAATADVIELNDKFLDIYKEGQWLVMMYAPWCSHCQRLQPIWAHAAQNLAATSIQVGKLDCTKYTNVAQQFEVRGFPTILFTKGGKTTIYTGDRSHKEIVKFAVRLNSPPVQEITRTENFNKIQNFLDLYFLYVGERSGDLWDIYHRTAEVFQPFTFFYQVNETLVDTHQQFTKVPSILVYKENVNYKFTGDNEDDPDKLNSTFYNWVNRERFLMFPEVTRGTINQLFLTKKYLVLAVVDENEFGDVDPDMLELRTAVESVIQKKREKYHDNFQFGWTVNSELVNSIALMEIPRPSLIVINTNTSHYHIPDDNPSTLDSHAIEIILEQIRNGTAPKYGGNSILVQVYRLWFDLKITLIGMFRANAILTVVLLGLPTLFFSLIFYIICCPNVVSDEDVEEEEKSSVHPHSE
ncbi:protein disulfide-isomerase TMX3-like [Fopius arisanus]|uniref:Protein disulfide-isomerase TMX3-like n=1 Tax=Fopius arisanus TaxID=64838 RepID=A0A9R1U7Z0_9HYME|nr:PREDICTED: protein disulfide-isomerase TMX3-like [Fopius arisanus]